jgi:hypothetical protein
MIKYDKQDQQGKATQPPYDPATRSPGGPQTKTGQGKDGARTG